MKPEQLKAIRTKIKRAITQARTKGYEIRRDDWGLETDDKITPEYGEVCPLGALLIDKKPEARFYDGDSYLFNHHAADILGISVAEADAFVTGVDDEDDDACERFATEAQLSLKQLCELGMEIIDEALAAQRHLA